MSLHGKTLFITGASRGIGREIALRAARDGANLVIAAKSAEPHPKLEGTIFSVAAEVEAAGGQALPLQLDVRDEQAVAAAMARAAERFGGIDALVNNAGAIRLVGVEKLEPKRFDLMYQINTRAVLVCSQAALPYLRRSANGHILQPVAADQPGRQVVRPARPLHGHQVRHEHAYPGDARGVREIRHQRQRAVAEDHDRHRRHRVRAGQP